MKINISIDDVSPHPKSSIKVLERCHSLIKSYPEIKFSLFIPIAYWRTVKPEVATEFPLKIDMFPDFCETLRRLPKNNFEICYHGLYHGIPGKSDNDEFQNLDYDQAIQKFQQMFEIVKNARLSEVFKPIFRPPAWRMSPDAIRAAKDMNIKILALSPDDYAMKTYGNEQISFEKVIYYTCNPPFKNLIRCNVNEVVYHACEWDRNYLSQDLELDLSNWILQQDNFMFCFMDEMG